MNPQQLLCLMEASKGRVYVDLKDSLGFSGFPSLFTTNALQNTRGMVQLAESPTEKQGLGLTPE